MLTYLNVMVKHLWCWHICKEAKEVKKGMRCCLWGAPSYPVRCTATPRAVTGLRGGDLLLPEGTATHRAVPTWTRSTRRSKGLAPSVTVWTALGATVHH
jgi:hypothetical protein